MEPLLDRSVKASEHLVQKKDSAKHIFSTVILLCFCIPSILSWDFYQWVEKRDRSWPNEVEPEHVPTTGKSASESKELSEKIMAPLTKHRWYKVVNTYPDRSCVFLGSVPMVLEGKND